MKKKRKPSRLRKMTFRDKWMDVKVSITERVDADFEVSIKNRMGFTEDFYVSKKQAKKLAKFLGEK